MKCVAQDSIDAQNRLYCWYQIEIEERYLTDLRHIRNGLMTVLLESEGVERLFLGNARN